MSCRCVFYFHFILLIVLVCVAWIRAIAAATKRTVIVLRLDHIQDSQKLYECFHSTLLAGQEIPHEERLYYIPEIDTQAKDVLLKREEKEKLKKEAEADRVHRATAAAAANVAPQLTPQQRTAMSAEDKPPPLSLGEILNVLDGVPERHGHIVVMVLG